MRFNHKFKWPPVLLQHQGIKNANKYVCFFKIIFHAKGEQQLTHHLQLLWARWLNKWGSIYILCRSLTHQLAKLSKSRLASISWSCAFVVTFLKDSTEPFTVNEWPGTLGVQGICDKLSLNWCPPGVKVADINISPIYYSKPIINQCKHPNLQKVSKYYSIP